MKNIKFCNIKNIFETRTAGKYGIPFLGFHLISDSDYQRSDILKSCVSELRNYYPRTKAVLVTKEQDADKLVNLINEFEFETVQLHNPDSGEIVKRIKGVYGSNVCVIQVITPETPLIEVHDETDVLLLDKSYLGGTGNQISSKDLESLLNKINFSRVLLAGGISHANLHEYLQLPVYGFDMQSALKSEYASKTENTDYMKMINTAELLGYQPKYEAKQVGFVIQDINQQNTDLLNEALKAQVDFLHVDVSDGFVSKPTNLESTKLLLAKASQINTHIPIQVHLFADSEDSIVELSKQIIPHEVTNVEKYVHINRDNYPNFSSDYIKSSDAYFALDVKDIIDETFPWEQYVKYKLLICLQSTQHHNRVDNLNSAIKMISYVGDIDPIITIDRSVDYSVLSELDQTENINVVCGSYLKENIEKRYNLLKKYLYARK